MKTFLVTLTLFVLVVSAFAQAPAPLKLTISSGHLTAENTSAQEVLAFVVQWSSVKYTNVPLSHDWYFKTHGVLPAETRELNGDLPEVGDITKAALLYAQFVDGTTWGDVTAAKDLSARRPLKKQFCQALSTAAGQGEAGFLERLNNEKVFIGEAKHLLKIQQQSSTQVAVDMVNEWLAAANSRSF